MAPPPPSPSDALTELHDWLQASGALLQNVRVAVDPANPSHRFLQATADIAPDTPFLRLPPTLVITEHTARAAPHVADVLRRTRADDLPARLPDTASDSAAILLFLMGELCRGDKSEWHAWLASLPTRAQLVTPLSVADEDRLSEVLYGTPALPFVQRLRAELREMYDEWFVPYAVRVLPEVYYEATCTYATFAYAHSLLESRAFKIDAHTVLAPFADMANHVRADSMRRNARQRGWALQDSPDDIGLELCTREGAAVKCGDELCITYGSLANWELLVHFGFALCNGNEQDEGEDDDGVAVELDGGLEEGEDLQTEMKKMIVLQTACGGDDLDFVLRVGDPLPVELVRCARVLLLGADEMENAVRRDYSRMVSTGNERKVVTWLRAIVEGLGSDCEGWDSDDDEDGDEGVGEGAIMDGSKEGESRLWQSCRVYTRSYVGILKSSLARINDLEAAIAGAE